MKHKAPCSSRGYSGLRESGPLDIDEEGDGDVGEDGGGYGEDHGDDDGPRRVPAPPEARGREPPSYSSSLTFSLDERRVSPLVLGSHGLGGARASPRLDLSLCFCILEFCPGTVSFISGDP